MVTCQRRTQRLRVQYNDWPRLYLWQNQTRGQHLLSLVFAWSTATSILKNKSVIKFKLAVSFTTKKKKVLFIYLRGRAKQREEETRRTRIPCGRSLPKRPRLGQAGVRIQERHQNFLHGKCQEPNSAGHCVLSQVHHQGAGTRMEQWDIKWHSNGVLTLQVTHCNVTMPASINRPLKTSYHLELAWTELLRKPAHAGFLK